MVMKTQNPNEMMAASPLTTPAVPDSVSLDLPPSIQSLLKKEAWYNQGYNHRQHSKETLL